MLTAEEVWRRYDWIEKWIARKRSTDARPMACPSVPNSRGERNDGRPVTCTG